MKDDILRIVKEDLLEELRRKSKKVSPLLIEPEIKVSHSFISKAIEELEKEGLIKNEQGLIFLTDTGNEKAEIIVKKHSVIENYFKKIKSKEEALKAASILEHYISMEIINNIEKLSTLEKENIPLVNSKKQRGLITDIVSDIELFERMVSMGISPGEEINIMNKLPNSVIIGIDNKKIALDLSLAKKVKILKE